MAFPQSRSIRQLGQQHRRQQHDGRHNVHRGRAGCQRNLRIGVHLQIAAVSVADETVLACGAAAIVAVSAATRNGLICSGEMRGISSRPKSSQCSNGCTYWFGECSTDCSPGKWCTVVAPRPVRSSTSSSDLRCTGGNTIGSRDIAVRPHWGDGGSGGTQSIRKDNSN